MSDQYRSLIFYKHNDENLCKRIKHKVSLMFNYERSQVWASPNVLFAPNVHSLRCR